ncbi:hypothetical protein FCV25MIE_00285 [Fagus crenata]
MRSKFLTGTVLGLSICSQGLCSSQCEFFKRVSALPSFFECDPIHVVTWVRAAIARDFEELKLDLDHNSQWLKQFNLHSSTFLTSGYGNASGKRMLGIVRKISFPP